jgi:RND family efflux transporter MFP subunit
MSFSPEQLSHFRTVASIRPPRIAVALAWMMVAGIAACVGLMFVPWVQTSAGTGQVIAIDPRDRVQNITALVPGRVEQWYVTDGQLVRKGDPIARIVDNDPQLLDRLRAERGQKVAEIAAARQAQRVAQIDVDRMGGLYREGLAARRDYEQAQIRTADYQAKVAQSQAEISRIDVNLNRQAVQIVRAPRDGRIMRIAAADNATYVSAGDLLATFASENSKRVVELYIDGRDVPLITPGRRVRLEFEGWPAVQFSGWPSVAVGVFDGRVSAIDVSASTNGLFRVLVEPAPDRAPWPKEPFVRLGAKAQGWVLMDRVTVGFEMWRLLNDFPLQWQRPADDRKAPAFAPEDEDKGANAK